MRSNVLIFEQFDDAAMAGAGAQKARAAEYAEGFAAGEAAALARATEQNHQLQAVTEAINAKLTEFDSAAAAALSEALADAVKAVLPALSRKYSAKEAVATLTDIFSNNENATLPIRIAPAILDIVSAAISASPLATRATVKADDTLSEDEIRAQWEHGGVTIDTEKAIAGFVAMLEEATEQLKDENGHG